MNWKLLASPRNWALVAFTMLIVIFVMHLFMRNNTDIYGPHA
jgi:hypothetical protein